MDKMMQVLAESENYTLCHDHEVVILVDKRSGEKTTVGEHHGDPMVGLIDPLERWVLTGGEGVQFFSFTRGGHRFLDSGFPDFLGRDQAASVVAARIDENGEVRILVDPWSDCPSTWVLDTEVLEIRKLGDGPDLRECPYREDVEY